ncbi:MAG: hypothetical protein II921_02550 [Treponema sp.]|nr:hypothetical protein [Treponema sp.]
MLKKVLAISAALLIGGGLFAQTSADGGAKPAKAGSVNAVYDFSKGKPAGTKIGEDMFKYNKPTEVAPKAKVKGGKFILESGEAKWKTEKYTALYHNNSGSTTFDNLQKKPKAIYSLTIDDAADIELTVAGNGSKEPSRCVALCSLNEDGSLNYIVKIDNLSQDEDPVKLTYKNAPKGKYYIYGNGHRILGVSATN